MHSDSARNSNLNSHDATTRSYSAIDVASFDPLITDIVLVEELAFALAPIQLPQPFSRFFATSKMGSHVGQSDEFSNYIDRHTPSRIYKNALRQIFENKNYKQRNSHDDSLWDVISYKLINYKGSKRSAENCTELLASTLSDIGHRIYDLISQPSIDIHDSTNDGEPLKRYFAVDLLDAEPATFEEWISQIHDIKNNAIAFGEFQQRINRISAVTPLGLMHRYRQHFFYADLQKGRCELIRSLAPYETLEVVTTEEKVTTTEETVIKETELTTNISRERKDSTELTDRVANTVARTSTTNMSVNGSYTAVLWSAGGSASSTTSESSSKTSERIAKTLNDITLKQSEQIRKKTTVTTRIAETRSDSITTRHTFQNPTEKPVTYGLYKLGYEVKSVIQDLGSLLVWQTRIEKPGQTLALSDLLDKQIYPASAPLLPLTVSITLQKSNIDNNGFSIDISEALELAFKKVMSNLEHLKPLKQYQEAFDNFYRTPGSNFKFSVTGLSLEAWYSGGEHGIPVNHSSDISQKKIDIKLLDSLKTTEIFLSKAIPRPNYFYLYATVEFQIPKLTGGGNPPILSTTVW